MRIRRHAIQLFTYAAAILGGLALVLSFARFNALHDEFLGANFDSVHGARTLLKAGFFLELAARDVASAGADRARRPALLAHAAESLALAENYGAEGRDKDPEVRAALTARIQALRSKLSGHQQAPAVADTASEYAPTLAAIHQLANDFGNTELDRWGTLSSANAALSERMAQLRLFIAASIFIFLLIMAILGWSLARTRRTEADLLLAKAKIEAIQQTTLDASAAGIAYVDTANPENCFIKVANRRMAELFAYPSEAMTGVSVARVYGAHESDGTYEQFSQALPRRLAAGAVVRDEVLMQRSNGERFWCSLSIKAIDPEDFTHGVVWTCEDISERKEAQEKLQLAMEKAEAASLAKSEFLANMSHELRTPFAGILGLLDLLQRTDLSETQQRYFCLARDSTTQVLAIVNDILDFSKIEAGKLSLDPVDFEPRNFLSALAEPHAAAAINKGLCLALDFSGTLPDCLHGDTVRIRQILDNLLGNAIKFTVQGGVTLRVECSAADGKTATLAIAVIDTGIGLPAGTHEEIFRKFTQADSSTSRKFGGTGLGLAICRQLATLMGGRITVDSISGEGSRFCLEIELPIASLAACADPVESGNSRPIVTPGTVVLLVDDHATNRGVFAELLGQHGCTVIEAASGAQAIQLTGEIRPDVILMDCQMPVIDGQEATRRIRAAEVAGERVPIIALTAHATSSDRVSSLASGMDDYLSKPVSPEMLMRRIARWTVRRRAVSAPFNGRILLVEDNLAIQEATRRLLERMGCEVIVAGDGQTALDLSAAAHDGGDFDVVLMDCRMPGMDGWETTRRWRQRERGKALSPTAIIAVTGCDRAETRQDCRAAGMNDIIVKPYPESSLAALLAEWLGEKTIGDPTAKDCRRG